MGFVNVNLDKCPEWKEGRERKKKRKEGRGDRVCPIGLTSPHPPVYQEPTVS